MDGIFCYSCQIAYQKREQWKFPVRLFNLNFLVDRESVPYITMTILDAITKLSQAERFPSFKLRFCVWCGVVCMFAQKHKYKLMDLQNAIAVLN